MTLLCEKISQESMKQLAEALYTNRTVIKLLLGGRELQEDAARALGRVLKQTSALRQLTWVLSSVVHEIYVQRTWARQQETPNLS